MRPFIVAVIAAVALATVSLTGRSSSAEACAGLIGSNGAVNLGRTTTLAGYHDGVEHYITAFQFQGGGGEFGSLIPLPGVPTNVERGGDWTLQRLIRETQQFNLDEAAFSPLAGASRAEVLQEVRIDALDITVLKGGAPDIAVWAKDHGFRLSPDAPEVLDFYAQRSPIFLAAVFDGDAAAARGQQLGDGTPVHLTIPTSSPWVPLRILGLGKQAQDFVDADVFLLTDEEPALLPAPGEGMFLSHSAAANKTLLDDLRADAGGSWVPESGWLTRLQINTTAGDLSYDLAVDPTGTDPSRVAAGLDLPDGIGNAFIDAVPADESSSQVLWGAIAGAVFLLILLTGLRFRSATMRK